MKYSIYAFPVADEKVAKLVARAIQSKAKEYSFSELTSLLLHHEFRVSRGLEKVECDQLKRQLEDLGVTCRVDVEAESEPKVTIAKVVKSAEVPPEVSVRVPTPVPQLPPLRTPDKPVVRSSMPLIFTVVILFTSILFIAILTVVTTKSSASSDFKIEGATFMDGNSNPVPVSEPGSGGSESKKERKSRLYLDSADQKCMSGGTDTEQFYRFALTYNNKNKDAWFGLLNCFRSTNREEGALKIEKEMVALFGAGVLDPYHLPVEYGEVDVITIKGTSASVVLKTKAGNNQLYSDLFQLARRYSALGTFGSLKVLVKRKDGTGMFMDISPIGCISYGSFIEDAGIEVIH